MGSATHPLLDPTRDEELRLALVMNGGVSLAVWMGGVAFEINRFIGETHDVYEGLLALTRTRARVDVISGASAGGINGAALAMGYVYDKSLYALRDIWLKTGAFGKLLRDPGESNPPSLLDGDGTFLPALEEAFGKLAANRPSAFASPSMLPMDLSLAATRLEGEQRTHLDDLGSVIEDLVHRTRFHFVRNDSGDAFEDPARLASMLSKAARTSASFPVAFEPSLCDPKNLGNSVDFTKPLYLIDGGLLDNKPLDHALAAIGSMKTEGNVRRVLGYIVPDPSVGSKPAESVDNDQKERTPTHSLGEIAVRSLITIPSAQSISTQLDAIRTHNAELPKRRRTLATIVANTKPKALEEMALALFETYRRRRIDGLIDFVLEQLEAAPKASASDAALGANTRRWLRALMVRQIKGTTIWDGFVPTGPDHLSAAFIDEKRWSWGLYTIEALAAIMFDLLRRTQRLHHLVDRPVAVSPQPVTRKAASDELTRAAVNWERHDSILRDVRQSRLGAERNEVPRASEGLPRLWIRAFELQAAIVRKRKAGSKWTREDGKDLLMTLRRAGLDNPGSEEVAHRVITDIIAWLRQYRDPRATGEATSENPEAREREAQLADLASEVGHIIADLKPVMTALLDSPSTADAARLREDEALGVSELRAFHDYVYPEDASPAAIVRQLLILEVLQYATSHRATLPDIPLELVQISANQLSPWGGPATPSEKLAGMQVGHFGSFYKKSWRANDWMMGRLDGIDRLLHIALNPDRLHRCYGGKLVPVGNGNVLASTWVRDQLHTLAVTSAAPDHRPLLEEYWNDAAVIDELRFLDAPNARVPDVLAHACEALIRRLELEVICRELPMMADAVSDDLVAGARDDTAGAELARRFRKGHGSKGQMPLPPDEIVHLFDTCRIGMERFAKEAGTDLFTRTIGHTVAVTHSAASGSGGGLGPVGALLKSVKLPVFMFYMLTDRLQNESRTAAAVTTAMLVAGISAVLASAATNASPVIATFGWALIAAWFGAALLRSRWATLFGAAVIVTLIAFGHSEKLRAGVVALVLLLALYFLPYMASAVILAMLAIWWTAGRPDLGEIAAAACHDFPRAPGCVANADASRGGVFISLSELLLLLIVVAVLAHVFGRRRSR